MPAHSSNPAPSKPGGNTDTTLEPVPADDTPSRRRRLEPDERRAQILACAIDMFGERPYAAVSTAELAQRAGVARGLINHYFGNKRDLYLAVVRRMVTLPRLDNMLVPSGNVRERVEASVSWLLDTIGEHGTTWVKVTGLEGIGDDPEVQRILDEADNAAADRVVQMMGLSDSLHSDELRALVRCYGGLVKAAGREWIVRGALDRAQVHELLSDTLTTLIAVSFPKVNGTR
ncbi:MAG: hypothetical protein JWN03_7521 [Nocardia sp.]|nr:hypothetical protein [Nocardia sp.]